MNSMIPLSRTKILPIWSSCGIKAEKLDAFPFFPVPPSTMEQTCLEG